MSKVNEDALNRQLIRYPIAVVAAVVALLCRQAMVVYLGAQLPSYITFYPAVIIVALQAGPGAGILATLVAALLAAYWVLPPQGLFLIANRPDAVGLAFFSGMGVLISLTAERYRRSREKASAYDKEKALRETQQMLQRYELLASHSRDTILFIRLDDGRILEANAAATEAYGYNREELLSMSIDDLRAAETQALTPVQLAVADVSGILFETIHQHKDGSTFHVEVSSGGVTIGDTRTLISSIRNITERKQAEQEREVTIEFLRLVNASTETRDLVHAAATFFQEQSGCQAVGIRLREGDDYPYFEARGFTREFVLAENRLCVRDATGGVVRDGHGNPILECMCGNIISGRFEPSKPFFTTRGSFWSNGTTELLARTTEADRQSKTRNRCNGEGYESVALIPLRIGEERFGLLQLNDRRKGRFSPEVIALWERLAGYLAVALAKFRAEEALRKSEAHFRSLFENMSEGFAYCKMLFDDHDRPEDFVYLNVNKAFGTLTGLREVTGKKVTEVIPGIKETQPELFEIFARVATTDQPENFEFELKSLGIWFSISAYSPEKEYFVAVFDVITERKRAEHELRTSLDEKTALLKEVHHRVKNNLQIVASLLNLQARRIKNPTILETLQDTQSRIRSMALLHETLYREGSSARINCAVYLGHLCDHLSRTFGEVEERVQLQNRIAPLELELDLGIPCGLIVNELISNAFKHAFPGERKGKITVELCARNDGDVVLSVADDGVGLPPGLDWQQTDTLGMQLITGLAQQIGATLEMKRDPGTVFQISFPVHVGKEL